MGYPSVYKAVCNSRPYQMEAELEMPGRKVPVLKSNSERCLFLMTAETMTSTGTCGREVKMRRESRVSNCVHGGSLGGAPGTQIRASLSE